MIDSGQANEIQHMYNYHPPPRNKKRKSLPEQIFKDAIQENFPETKLEFP